MKQVGIADLKAHLSAHIRSVRRGHALTVTDRDRPIARLGPHDGEAVQLEVRLPDPKAPPLGRVRLPPRLDSDVDVLDLLDEERQERR